MPIRIFAEKAGPSLQKPVILKSDYSGGFVGGGSGRFSKRRTTGYNKSPRVALSREAFLRVDFFLVVFFGVLRVVRFLAIEKAPYFGDNTESKSVMLSSHGHVRSAWLIQKRAIK